MKFLKRAAALTAAFLITLSFVINPIKASAAASVGVAIGAGWVLDLAFSGYITSEAVEGSLAIKESLENGTIDNNVEQWLWDKASEYYYGYNQAQVEGEIYKAELTYGDLKALAALLSEAYPEGQVTTSRGHVVNKSNVDDFPVPLPIETNIFFTDTTQTGETAITKCFFIYTEGANIRYKLTTYELPSGSVTSSLDNLLLGNGNCEGYAYSISLESNGAVKTHLIRTSSNGNVSEDDFYQGNIGILSSSTLISYSMPTYAPGVGVGSATSADIQSLIDALEEIPYGMSEDDVAISIPVTGEDDDTTIPGVVPDSDELIENVPAAEIEGDFSGFTIPNGLMYVFPFSLPYDFYRGIKLFAASPEVPEFTFDFIIPYPSGMGNGNLVEEKITINFKQFEKLAIISRWTSTFAFTMLLINLSAFILKGGNS